MNIQHNPASPLSFNRENFHRLCDQLSEKDPGLKFIIENYGYPPLWSRRNSFATIIHIILEQQVSLASAKAAFDKLKQKLGSITPARLLLLSDDEMKACYFSRQKMGYARHLARHMLEGKIRLRHYPACSDEEIRNILKQVPGIGDWTTDVYLLFALQRTDIFPVGDLAMVNALKALRKPVSFNSRADILKAAEAWRPYRSIATMLLWHYYIQTRKMRV